MKNLTKRIYAVVAAATLIIGVGYSSLAKAESVPESTDPIKLSIGDWTGNHVTTHVAGEILKRMGYEVEYVVAGDVAAVLALHDNSITAALENWEFTQGEQIMASLDGGNIVDLGGLGLVPWEGWIYPGFVEETCPGLPSWEALQDCAELFAVPETFPMGRILDYPSDWGSISVNKVEAFGLEGKLVNKPGGSEGSMISEIRSAFERQQPILVSFWNPHWVFGEFDLRSVEMPAYEDGCDMCGWPVSWIKKVAWIGMEDKWPVAYRFLQNYQMTNEMQVPMLKAIDSDGMDAEAVTMKWVDENEDIWRAWVDAAHGG